MDTPAFAVNVDCAVVRGDEYLFIERGAGESHAPGVLAFPGGAVEPGTGGDAVERTARRELAEEVGVAVDTVEYVGTRTFVADDGTPSLNVVTLCTYADGEARRRAPGEVAAVRWLTPEAAATHENAPDYLRRDIERVQAVRRDRS